MKFSGFLFRYRRWVLIAIFVLAFWAPFDRLNGAHPASTWLWLAGALTSYGLLSMAGSTLLVIGVATFLAWLAALVRTWAAAYLGSQVVRDPELHTERVVADGPYRYVRNPLYLGTWLYTMALAILMPPGGALFAVAAVAAILVALVRAEEGSLKSESGDAYTAYLSAVPRFLPSLTPRVPAAGARPHWMQGILGEIYIWGAVITYVAFADRYNVTILIQGVLISLGISIVLRAFLRPTTADAI